MSTIRLPKIILKTTLSNGIIVFITEYLEDAVTVSTLLKTSLEKETQKDILEKIFELIAQFHKAGLAQKDLHLDNFILKGDVLYAIDAANLKKKSAPLSSAAALKNLALFFAQFDDNLYPLLLKAFPVYSQINPDLSAMLGNRLELVFRQFVAQQHIVLTLGRLAAALLIISLRRRLAAQLIRTKGLEFHAISLRVGRGLDQL